MLMSSALAWGRLSRFSQKKNIKYPVVLDIFGGSTTVFVHIMKAIWGPKQPWTPMTIIRMDNQSVSETVDESNFK